MFVEHRKCRYLLGLWRLGLFVLAGLHIGGEVFADDFADGGVVVFDGVVVVTK